jgi:hypothetical protein
MRRAAVTGFLSVWALALMTGCGSPAATPRASASTSVSPAATATSAPTTPTQTALQAVYARLYPSSAQGGNCSQSSGAQTPSFSACPVTPRLAAALAAALVAHGSGAGADPICGCQNIDPNQIATYSVGTPPGDGTIHVAAFGMPHIAYVVVASGGTFLVDDIIYCGSSVTSIYPGETPASC